MREHLNHEPRTQQCCWLILFIPNVHAFEGNQIVLIVFFQSVISDVMNNPKDVVRNGIMSYFIIHRDKRKCSPILHGGHISLSLLWETPSNVFNKVIISLRQSEISYNHA